MLEEAMLWDIQKINQSSNTTVSSQHRVHYAKSTNETLAPLSQNFVAKGIHLLFLTT